MKLSEFALSKKGKVVLIISSAVTAAIMLIMNLVLIPKIESSTGGIRCFDMNFAYSFDTANRFLSALSESGKSTYLNIQLPLDFVYPIAYLVFFSFLIIRLTKRATPLLAVPIALSIFDYAENICSIIMLKAGEATKLTAGLGSAFTSVKTVLMYATFLIIIICIINCLRKKKADV